MRKDRILPVAAIARGHRGCMLGIEGAEPGFVQMTPWYSSSPWREAVIEGRASVLTRAGRSSPPLPIRAVTLGSRPGDRLADETSAQFRLLATRAEPTGRRCDAPQRTGPAPPACGARAAASSVGSPGSRSLAPASSPPGP